MEYLVSKYVLTNEEVLVLSIMNGLREAGYEVLSKTQVNMLFTKKFQDYMKKFKKQGLVKIEPMVGIEIYSISEEGKKVIEEEKIRKAISWDI